MENARVIREGLADAGYAVYGGVNAPYIWMKTPGTMTSWEFFDYLLENAGIEGSAYDRFTAAVRREYPAINILGYSDAAGELHSVSELGQEPLLSDYRKVAYYNLFDHGKVKKSLFE